VVEASRRDERHDEPVRSVGTVGRSQPRIRIYREEPEVLKPPRWIEGLDEVQRIHVALGRDRKSVV
jgi:hypothetical protein